MMIYLYQLYALAHDHLLDISIYSMPVPCLRRSTYPSISCAMGVFSTPPLVVCCVSWFLCVLCVFVCHRLWTVPSSRSRELQFA
jgi:hypothetical protein